MILIDKQKLIHDIVSVVAQFLTFRRIYKHEEFAFIQLIKKYNRYFPKLDIDDIYRQACARSDVILLNTPNRN